jgi:hypothetical protein
MHEMPPPAAKAHAPRAWHAADAGFAFSRGRPGNTVALAPPLTYLADTARRRNPADAYRQRPGTTTPPKQHARL